MSICTNALPLQTTKRAAFPTPAPSKDRNRSNNRSRSRSRGRSRDRDRNRGRSRGRSRSPLPIPPSAAVALSDVFTWLVQQRIVTNLDEVDLKQLYAYGVVDGFDVLDLTDEELTKAGFKAMAMRKLLKLKANSAAAKPL